MALPKLESNRFKLKLPSTGKTIEYKPYTVKEEKFLLLARESEDPTEMYTALEDLLKACTFDKVDIRRLPVFEFEQLFIAVRAKSVGEIVPLQLSCSSCEVKSPVDINLLDAKVEGDMKRKMTIDLSDSIGITMSYPRFSTAEIIIGEGDEADKIIDVLVDCVDSIYDNDNVYPAEEHTKEELKEFIESLSAAQFQKLLQVYNNAPSTVLDIDFKCFSCGHDNHIKLEGMSSFF